MKSAKDFNFSVIIGGLSLLTNIFYALRTKETGCRNKYYTLLLLLAYYTLLLFLLSSSSLRSSLFFFFSSSFFFFFFFFFAHTHTQQRIYLFLLSISEWTYLS